MTSGREKGNNIRKTMGFRKFKNWVNRDSTKKLYYRFFAVVLFIDFQILVTQSMLGIAVDPNVLSAVVTVLNIIILGTIGSAAAPHVASFVGKSIGRIRGKKNGISDDSAETRNPERETNNVTSEIRVGKNLLYETAKKYIGIREIVGHVHNPTIMNWIRTLGFDKLYKINSDEEPWCGTFACGCAHESQLEHPNSPNAKQWLTVGQPWKPGDTLPDCDYGIVAVSHRQYISNSELDGPGHVEPIDPYSFKNDGSYTSVGGNLNSGGSPGHVGMTTRSTKDPMLIRFILVKSRHT